MMIVSILEKELILKYVLINVSICNDEIFKSSLLWISIVWNIKVNGLLMSCFGFFIFEVIDEVDSVLVF